MSNPQSAILKESGRHGIFIIANINDPSVSLAIVKQQIQHLALIQESINNSFPNAQCCSSLAFGSTFWDLLCQTRPAQLKPFMPLGQGDLSAPATGGDLLLHIHANEFDLCYKLADSFLTPLQEHISILDEVHGFRYLDNRDLTGFIDGTENPTGDDRADVALIQDNGMFHAGSYVLVQRFVHNLKAWNTLNTPAQEAIIGRTKDQSIELEESKQAIDAHIRRVVIEQDGQELEILRHSMPYGKVTAESGLLFIAYSADLSIFDKMLANMYGTSGDDLHDKLMHFSKAVTGAYFFAPSAESLAKLS